MAMKRVIQSVVVMGMLLSASLAFGQYGEDPYMEGYVGANYTLPMGYMKNDLMPDSLNASGNLGFDLGLGYYVNPKLSVGLYFNLRNMNTEGLDLSHHVYEVGTYGRYFLSNISETSFSPYARLSAGVNFSKLVTRVEGEGGPSFRELSMEPTLGLGFGLGMYLKTNDYGAVYIEGIYNYDFTSGIVGEFKGVDYVWGDNNQYLSIKAGIAYNIGPKE